MNASKKLLCMLSVSVLSLTVMSIGVHANTGKSVNSSGLQQAIGKVEGTVVDQNGEPLIGVSVVIDGTTTGTTTDIDGKYSLTVKEPNANLVFSYVGHKAKIVPANKSVINITMEEDAQMMDEVVVVGYGVMKKSDVTGAISSVKADAIVRQPVVNVTQALQGLVAGVNVTSNSGMPGGAINVSIRGIGTVNDAGPLYVVDGMPTDNISFLSSSEIQSMEILKDASATAIYGARGANGVILVTTKQGKAGKTTVTVDAYWGASKILNNLDLMSGSEWYSLEVAKGLNVDDFTNKYHLSQNTSTDWMKEITRTAATQSYSVGISGGMADEYTYNTTLNYIDQEGTIKKTDYERISLRQNIEKTIVKKILSVGTNLNISQSKANQILEGSNTVGIVNSATKLEPVIPVKDASGNYGWSPYADYNNPVADLEYTNNETKIFRLVGNMYADLNIMKYFKFKTSFGADIVKTDTYKFLPTYNVSSYQTNPMNQVTRGYRKFNYYVWENTLSYIKTFAEKHNINAVIGYTNEWGRTETLQGIKRNTPNNSSELQYLDAAQTGDAATGTAWESSLISYLGRVNYNFDNRYLITASVRHDGSSRFGSSHKYGTFPSAALGWNISNENFFKDLNAGWVSNLKLRAGWGRIGNQNIGDYRYQNLLTNFIQYSYLYGTNESLQQGIAAVAMGNKDVKWESTESTNIGFDANLLNGRLTFSGEYYNKETKDMLITEPIPNYMGYETGPLTNAGSATNRGVEFTVDWRDHIGSFNYNIGFNISTVRNRMTSLGDAGTPMVGGTIRNGNATYTRIGYPIGGFYGYKTNGLIQTNEQLVEVRKLQPNAELGDVVFVNTNGDNVLNDKDKTLIGNPNPDFIYGINLGAEYKGFDLNIQLGGTYGNDIFNAMRYFTYDLASMTNKDRKMLNYWTPENRNTDVPRLAKVDTNDNKRISDRYVEDGSYLRLRNVQLGYTFPISLTKKAYMQKVRVYVTGQNLLTFTKYSGTDPEIGFIGESILSNGVDMGTYPQAMTITGGISITF